MSNGIVLLDKAAGLSSAQAIAQVKRKLNLNKIGHAGTLDPMATGLLVCLTGKATRLASYAECGRKRYRGSIRLGISTETDDVTGRVLREAEVKTSIVELRRLASCFEGEISQAPPRVSALKVAGQRAYRIVREGGEPALKERRVQVFRFEIVSLEGAEAGFVLECSRGTYARALARDLGDRLGCGGALSVLRREASAPFDISQARPLEELEEVDVIGPENLFPAAGRLFLDEGSVRRLSSGDEGFLREVTGNVKVEPGAGQLLYFNRGSGSLAGLLVCGNAGWEFGVNF